CRQARLVRFATPAGTEAGPFGIGRTCVERNVLRPGGARRTAGPAVHTRPPDRVEEAAVRIRVTAQHRGPSRIRDRFCRPLLVADVRFHHWPSISNFDGATVDVRKLPGTPGLAFKFDQVGESIVKARG